MNTYLSIALTCTMPLLGVLEAQHPEIDNHLATEAALEMLTASLLDVDTTIILASCRLDKYRRLIGTASYTVLEYDCLGATPFFTISTLRSQKPIPEVIFIRTNDYDRSLGRALPPEYVPCFAVGDSVWLCFLKPVQDWPLAMSSDGRETTKWLLDQRGKIPVHQAIATLGVSELLNHDTWYEPQSKLAMFQLDVPVPEMPRLDVHPLNKDDLAISMRAMQQQARRMRSLEQFKLPAGFLDDLKVLIAHYGTGQRGKSKIALQTKTLPPTDLRTNEARDILKRILVLGK